MSWCRASSAAGETSESISDDGVLIIVEEELHKTTATIFYKKSTIKEITNCENPFRLEISYDGKSYRIINCYVENLKSACEGNYYGPFPILVSGDRSTIKCFFREDLFKDLRNWKNMEKLNLKNDDGSHSWLYRYILDTKTCEFCDLSLVPSRIPKPVQSSFSPGSETQSLISLQNDSTVYGVINIEMDFPSKASVDIKLNYVKPLEADLNRCAQKRGYPLQFVNSDGFFKIIPCLRANLQKEMKRTKSSVFDIEVKQENGRYTSWECYIPNVPTLLESILSSDFPILVENLKNAREGIYYGPYKIFVDDKSENGSTFKCYYHEEFSKILKDSRYVKRLFFRNDDGTRSWIYKYIVSPIACQWCDLSLAPSRILKRMQSSFFPEFKPKSLLSLQNDPTVYGSIIIDMSDLLIESKLSTLFYVKPLEEEMDDCPPDEYFPLQFLTSDECFKIIPCLRVNDLKDDNVDFPSVFDIQIISRNGIFKVIRSYIPNLRDLFQSQYEYKDSRIVYGASDI